MLRFDNEVQREVEGHGKTLYSGGYMPPPPSRPSLIGEVPTAHQLPQALSETAPVWGNDKVRPVAQVAGRGPGSHYRNPRALGFYDWPAEKRRGDFLQTYTGRQFWPMDPLPEEISIEDIAHSLAMQCRYAGHCLRFYSVAEHSVHVARWCGKHYGAGTGMAGLLHDAAEAYLVDVPRPVKPFLPGYKQAESAVMQAVCRKFDLPTDVPAIVHEADNRILADEVRQNMRPMDWHAKHDDPLGVRLGFWNPELAKQAFLREFDELWEKNGRAA